MRVAFVFPPLTMKERYSKSVGDIGGNLAPLGLAYLAAVLRQDGHEVMILDAPALRLGADDVVRRLSDFGPEMIGMTALTSTIHRTAEMSRLMKKSFPRAAIVIGGPHATIMPEDTLKKTGADVVLAGEGEITVREIARDLGRFRKKRIVVGERVEDLDSVPFPAWDLLPVHLYTSLPNNYKKSRHVLNMVTSRGCPFRCTYCCKDLYGVMYRTRSVDNVMAELRFLRKRYGIREVAFWDDLFTMKRDWVMEFCDRLIAEGMDMTWSCETRVNYVDYEMLKKMKQAGCWNVFYGIEAGDQKLLNNIRKGTTLDMIRKAVRMTRKAGLEIRGSFMIALPGETPELARKTIKFAIELDPDYAQFSITTPFPGTELYEKAEEWGTLSKDFNEYNEWNPVFVPRGYRNAGEIRKMHKEAFRSFYLRPKYIVKRIMKIRSPDDVVKNILGLRMILGFN